MLFALITVGLILFTFLLLSLKESYAYYFLIFIATFSQSMPILSIGTRSINLGMDTLVIICIIVWHFSKRPKRREKSIFIFNKLTIIVLIWAVWNTFTVLISAITNYQPKQSIECLVVLMRWLQYLPIFFIVSKGKLDEIQIKRLLYFLALTALLASVIGLNEFFTGLNFRTFKGISSFTRPIFREQNLEDYIDPISGAYTGEANSNVVGAYFVLVISIFLPFILKRKKLLGYLFLGILLLANILTFSKVSNIAAFIIVSIGLFSFSKRKLIGSILLVAPIVAILASQILSFRLIKNIFDLCLNIWVVAPMVLNGQHWQLNSPYGAGVFGAAQRLIGIQEALKIFIQSPIWGCGYNGFKFLGINMFTADDFYLQTLAETGLVGFFLMIIFHISLLRLSFQNKSFALNINNSFFALFKTGFSYALLTMIIVNLTSGIFYIQKIWGPFIIIAGILLNYKNKNTQMSTTSHYSS